MSGKMSTTNRHQCYVISDGKEFFNGINVWLGKKITTDNPAAAQLFVTEEAATKKLQRMERYKSTVAFLKDAAVYLLTMDVTLNKMKYDRP